MIHSFLMIGQSNMAGRGFLNDVPPIYNERIKMLRNGLFQFMEEPINYDRSVAGVGLAASFAAAWCKRNKQDEIGLIPCAEGGSSLDDWSVDGALFANAIAQTKLAQRISTLAGIIWHQGESESHSGKYRDYYDKFLIVIERLRQELNAPEIPLIIGGLGDYLGDGIMGGHFKEYNQVNEELKRFAHSQNNCCYVTAEGLTCNPDGIHLNAVSQRIFGLRYYEAYDQKCHILAPVKDENKAIEIDSDRPHTKTEKAQMLNVLFFGGKISFEEYQQKMSQIGD
jgi:hypothetical protein